MMFDEDRRSDELEDENAAGPSDEALEEEDFDEDEDEDSEGNDSDDKEEWE